MIVKIKRLDTDLPLPQYETGGSVGFDLLCRELVTIAPQTVALIPANVIIETPPGVYVNGDVTQQYASQTRASDSARWCWGYRFGLLR